MPRLRLRPRAGSRYAGLVAYCTDYGLVDRPGYYALSRDGKRLLRPRLRLTWVDDAAGDDTDGSGHYEVAAASDPISRSGPVVPLEVHVEGTAEVAT